MSKLSAEPEGYAECYPGFEEMNDALEDSDDEADYSKMDLVNFQFVYNLLQVISLTLTMERRATKKDL